MTTDKMPTKCKHSDAGFCSFCYQDLEARLEEANKTSRGLLDQFVHAKNQFLEAQQSLSLALKSIEEALNELGVPQPDYPAPVTNAVNILRQALSPKQEEE